MLDLKADVSRLLSDQLCSGPSYMVGEVWCDPLGAPERPGFAESALVMITLVLNLFYGERNCDC